MRAQYGPPLPVRRPLARRAAPAADLRGYEGPRRRILVADDRRVNRMVLLDLLEPLGFEVACAADGREAARLAAERAPDLALMDLVMPRMSGFEATAALRGLPGLEALPIIAVSSSVTAEGLPQTGGARFDAFLAKPVDVDALLALIADHLDLRWTGAAPPPEAPPEEDAPRTLAPPPEALASLRALAARGRLPRLAKEAAALGREDPALAPFAPRAVALAEAFDDRALLAWLDGLSAPDQPTSP